MAETEKPPSAKKPKRGRSPNYPGIPLEQAVSRARQIYEAEHRNSATVKVIQGHWGYTNPKSGVAAVTYAALRKFGLLDEDGTGPSKRVRLSARALLILLNPDDQKRQNALETAALEPKIHKDLWERLKKEGAWPSDSNLRYELQEQGFTDNGANEFLKQVRATFIYAKLDPSTTMGDGNEDKLEDEEGFDVATTENEFAAQDQGKPIKTRTLTLPLSPSDTILIRLPNPMTKRYWELMLAALEAMKPGIVPDELPDQGQESDQ